MRSWSGRLEECFKLGVWRSVREVGRLEERTASRASVWQAGRLEERAASGASGGAYGKLGVWGSGWQIKACGKLGVWGVEKSYYLGDWRKALDKTYYKLGVWRRREDVLSLGRGEGVGTR